MATIATLIEPTTISVIQDVQPIPVGPLMDRYLVTSIVGIVGNPINNRFPTPPKAGGFLTEVVQFIDDFEDGVIPYTIDGFIAPYLIIGAIYPESKYLESTVGQIWPRTG